MRHHDIEIVCPQCHAELERHGDQTGGTLACVACERRYPIVIGIPDLRLWPDPYIGFEEDRAKGVMLHEHSDRLDFAAGVRFYYSVTEKVPPFQALRFARGLMAAQARATHALDDREDAPPDRTGAMTLLDVGCGTAPLLVTAAARYQAVVGIDVAFRWLVLARRRLADAGVDVPLLCANAEALPFRAGAFDRVVCDSTLEHLRDAGLALDECARVTRPDAKLFVATPNRFSIGPDPHTGLPAGGFLPAAFVAAYVRAKGGVPPERRLYGPEGLRRLLDAHGFVTRRVGAPPIASAQLTGFGRAVRIAAVLYNAVLRFPPGRMLLDRIGPLLHAVADRAGEAVPVADGGRSTPARGSRP